MGPSSNGVCAASSNSPSYASFSFPKLNGSPTRPFMGGYIGGQNVTPVDTVLDRYGRTGPAANALHGGPSAFMFNPIGQGRFTKYTQHYPCVSLCQCRHFCMLTNTTLSESYLYFPSRITS